MFCVSPASCSTGGLSQITGESRCGNDTRNSQNRRCNQATLGPPLCIRCRYGTELWFPGCSCRYPVFGMYSPALLPNHAVFVSSLPPLFHILLGLILGFHGLAPLTPSAICWISPPLARKAAVLNAITLDRARLVLDSCLRGLP